MIDFEPFDLDGVGITIPAVDLPAEPLPALLPSWRETWWSRDGHHSLEEYAADTIRRYARPTLNRLDASKDDAVFEHCGEMASLDDLTKPFLPVTAINLA